MRPITLVAPLLLSLCCCQKAADKAPPLPERPDPALKSAMWSMVTSSSALSDLLGKAAAPTRAELEEARRLVGEVHKTAATLASDPKSQAHPLLGAGLPAFLADVEAARGALSKEPPDLEPARRLAASCRGCHGVAAWVPPAEWRLALR